MNNFEGRAPSFNPMNNARPHSSTMLNLDDSIQVHMLVETALGDSRGFEVLSEDEVDDLKKETNLLSQRMEQTRQNLIIQSKYRDAARSMSKLSLPSEKKKSLDGANGKIRGIMGHNRNSSEHAQEANQERLASEKKCEELASELWFLEKRLMEPQTRLLKHTAGILQMTHKGPKVTQKGAPAQNGDIPGSPESMYTYSNARNSFEPLPTDDLFDERSLYRSFDRLDAFGELGGEHPSGTSKEQMQMIQNTEQKLEDLNSRLREVIIEVNPQQQANFGAPPLSRTNADGRPTEPGETLQQSLVYLEQGIATIGREQKAFLGQNNVSEAAMEETIEELNRDLHSVLRSYDGIRQPPPQLTGRDLSNQLAYFQYSVKAVESELSRASNLTGRSNENQEQMEVVMMGLWDIILSGEGEARQRKAERAQNRSLNNLPPDEDESGDDEDVNEQFSLQAFSTKVQWLYSQATKLKDQKKVLQRQIKQQRELNNKSDAAKDADITQKSEELARVQDLLRRTEMDSDRVREQLSLVMEKLDEARQQDQLRDQARSNDESSAIRAAQQDLDVANDKLATLEEELQELKDDHLISNAETSSRTQEMEANIQRLTRELATASQAQLALESNIKAKDGEIAEKEKEAEDMNIRLATLQTEVTMARAELDGAYGSKSQRAAEVAANPAIQKEINDLSQRNTILMDEIAALEAKGTANPETEDKMRTLKKELEETIEEYEQMTKASIEWEKEREQLEGTVDKLRDEREQLEAQLSDEKVRWLGMKSPGIDGPMPGAGSTSTTVLKNEFKKMMRDTRAESAKALRVCCAILSLFIFSLPFSFPISVLV
ncbi:Up-regulated during septation-domain-containing protein [Amylocarpus encephaloides]|uniref:Up-regulated during septation-domain-containing protein n=1 Tax=Amylocarpus encephaloides TaxID=45428 RepID=A0A9P8CBT2_9HELO|nr:Up-regulated during septation-domain-containing protein [Amylocarpus encephaloides]